MLTTNLLQIFRDRPWFLVWLWNVNKEFTSEYVIFNLETFYIASRDVTGGEWRLTKALSVAATNREPLSSFVTSGLICGFRRVHLLKQSLDLQLITSPTLMARFPASPVNGCEPQISLQMECLTTTYNHIRLLESIRMDYKLDFITR